MTRSKRKGASADEDEEDREGGRRRHPLAECFSFEEDEDEVEEMTLLLDDSNVSKDSVHQADSLSTTKPGHHRG